MTAERAPYIDALCAGRSRAHEEFRLLTPPEPCAVHAETRMECTDAFNEDSAYSETCPERLQICRGGGAHFSAEIVPSEHTIYQVQALSLEPARRAAMPQ